MESFDKNGAMKVFILNGKPRAGKDTFACMLDELCHQRFHDVALVRHYSMVSRVKEIASTFCGWTGGKTDADRDFLSDLKDLCDKYCDMSFKDCYNKAIECSASGFRVMLIDSREPADIKRLCEALGAKSVFIDNERVNVTATNRADNAVCNMEYDYIVHNNGTMDEFRSNVLDFAVKTGIVEEEDKV